MARRSSNRGLASMDPERRRQIASEGGRASRGGRGRSDDDYDRIEDEDNDYESTSYGDEEDDEGGRGYRSGSRRGFASMDPEDRRRIASREGNTRWEEDDEGYDDERVSRKSRSSSRRGFASMDPEERRRIANREVRSRLEEDDKDFEDRSSERSRKTSSRGDYEDDYFEETGRRGGESLRDEYGPEYYSERRGGRAKWEEVEGDYDDRGRRSQSSRRGFGSRSSGINSGKRGFAAMDPEERRRIAAKGGRASHG
jgi:hypothetical protein